MSETHSLSSLQDTSKSLSLQILSSEEKAARTEAELRIEREWRNDLQSKESKTKDQIHNLQLNIKHLNDEAKVFLKSEKKTRDIIIFNCFPH